MNHVRTEGLAWDITEGAEEGRLWDSSRRIVRLLVDFDAQLRSRGDRKAVQVHILDLSTNGFRIESWINLAVGTDVWLRLPGLEACHAKVVWVSGDMAGCEFERPLHTAVLARLVRR